MNGHVCETIKKFPLEKFHQLGKGRGRKVLIIGESPAPNGWRMSGIACYRPDGKILPTGRRLNELLRPFELSVETCGFTELSKCYVSKRTELQGCSKKCFPILLAQLKGKQYRLLIILGLHTTHILSNILGKELNIGEIQEIVLERKAYKVLPIYHPSPVNPHGRMKNTRIFRKLNKEIDSLL